MSRIRPGDWVERDKNSKGSEIKLVVAIRDGWIWYADSIGDNDKPSISNRVESWQVSAISECKGFDDYEYRIPIEPKELECVHAGRTAIARRDRDIPSDARVRLFCLDSELESVFVRVTHIDEEFICFRRIQC